MIVVRPAAAVSSAACTCRTSSELVVERDMLLTLIMLFLEAVRRGIIIINAV